MIIMAQFSLYDSKINCYGNYKTTSVKWLKYLEHDQKKSYTDET